MEHDYERLDHEREFKFADDMYQQAYKHGYYYISEWIIMTYRRTRSSTKTGEIVGKRNSTILNFLHWAKEPVQGKGGHNY